MDMLVRRASEVGGVEIGKLVRGELHGRLDGWLAEAQRRTGGSILGYDERRDRVTVALLRRPSLEPWDDFTCLMSLRDVEPPLGLILDDGGLDDDPEFALSITQEIQDEGEAE